MRKVEKAAISLSLTSLLIISLFTIFFANFYPVSAQNGTSVGGEISIDTIWTKANSPYNLTSNIIIIIRQNLQ